MEVGFWLIFNKHLTVLHCWRLIFFAEFNSGAEEEDHSGGYYRQYHVFPVLDNQWSKTHAASHYGRPIIWGLTILEEAGGGFTGYTLFGLQDMMDIFVPE